MFYIRKSEELGNFKKAKACKGLYYVTKDFYTLAQIQGALCEEISAARGNKRTHSQHAHNYARQYASLS